MVLINLAASFSFACGVSPESVPSGPIPDTRASGTDLGSVDLGEEVANDVPSGSDTANSADGQGDADWVGRPDIAASDIDLDPADSEDGGSIDCTAGFGTTDFGLSFAIELERCVFSLTELQSGVEFSYEVRVQESGIEVWSRPLDAGGCATPSESGIAVMERVEGGEESWCICDEGLCMEPIRTFALLTPGTYEASIRWDGRNWFGPSDFGNPPGEAFPPGEYLVVVRGAGSVRRLDGVISEWDISAAAPIWVVE